jgi:hypothetical protein
MPVVLVGRSDTLEARTASCVLALLLHAAGPDRAESPPSPPESRGDGTPDDGRAIAA